MMSVLFGMERTETQRRTLLGSVGMEAVHFHLHKDSRNTEGLFEATMKSESVKVPEISALFDDA